MDRASSASIEIAREVGVKERPAPVVQEPAREPVNKPAEAPRLAVDPQPPASKRNVVIESYNRIVSRREARIAAAAEEEASTVGRARRIILRLVAAFAALSCMVASVYFSYHGLVEAQPPAIAAIMALTIVSTLSVAPELAVAMLRKRRAIVAVISMSISLVATVFSMSQTVQGVYNARTARVVAAASEAEDKAVDSAESVAAAERITLLTSRLERLEPLITADQDAFTGYQSEIDRRLAADEDPESRQIRSLVANRNAARLRLYGDSKTPGLLAQAQAIEDEISSLAGLAVLAMDTSEEEKLEARGDFASWLGGRLGQSPEQTEFVLAVLPALFIDIIAPVMLVVAFAL